MPSATVADPELPSPHTRNGIGERAPNCDTMNSTDANPHERRAGGPGTRPAIGPSRVAGSRAATLGAEGREWLIGRSDLQGAVMELPIPDRTTAGQALGEALTGYAGRDDTLVLALPRGGLPVGYEVARRIGAPLDLMVIRKLGAPGHEELAMGAIAPGGVRVMNHDLVGRLGVGQATVEAVAEREQRELERRLSAYRGPRPLPDITGRIVILVDDGIATGATVRAALTALRTQRPAHLVVAAPVAPPAVATALRQDADEVFVLETPEPFLGVSRWYADFPQLGDAEVREVLGRAWAE